MGDDIKLSQQELDEIKDNERFKERTTLTLKYLTECVKDIRGLRTQVMIQWWFIAGITLSVIGSAFWVIRAGMQS